MVQITDVNFHGHNIPWKVGYAIQAIWRIPEKLIKEEAKLDSFISYAIDKRLSNNAPCPKPHETT